MNSIQTAYINALLADASYVVKIEVGNIIPAWGSSLEFCYP